jgi:hypothetical protein
MLINQIDELFDSILNNFSEFLFKKNVFKKFSEDSNFVVFQNDILLIIKDFIKTINPNDILKIVKKNDYYDTIINIVKRYCAFYVYLGIGYYYKDGRDLFITNIIEIAKNQKDATITIQNFFNSDNNSKIIYFYNIIQNINSLIEFKTIDKIKIIINNNPIKYDDFNKIFNELGEDYFVNYFLIKDNFHNILKTLIFKFIYLKEEKNEINNLLNEIEKDKSDYKYIDVIVSSIDKIVDFNVIQKFLDIKQLRKGMAEEIYNYLLEQKETKEIIIRENQDFINYLFSNQILIPITEEFLRYHKDSEKYDFEVTNKKEDTKIKYIVNKMNNIINYYSPIITKNPKLKLEVERYFFKNLDPRMAVLYNDNEEIKIIQKLLNSDSSSDADLLIDLENIRKYAYVNFKNVSRDAVKVRTKKTIECIRFINLKKKKSESLETRIGHDNISMNVVGVAFNPSRMNLEKTKRTLTPLECFTVKDLIDVRQITKKDNGFLSFIKVIEKAVKVNNNKLYYWIFNNNTDIPKLNKYVDYNKLDSEKNFKIMLAELYNVWIDLVTNKFNNYVNKLKNIDVMNLEYLLNTYQKKYFNFDFNPEIKNQLINKTLYEKFKEIKIIEDDLDNVIPGLKNKVIKLPTIEVKVNKQNIIVLKEGKEIIEDSSKDKTQNAICNHYIKWTDLLKNSKIQGESFNQMVFEFVKKYVKENEKGDYICKSCNEMLSLKKFVKEGTYVKELDEFMTTSLVVSQNLDNLPQYINLKRTINNLNKNLEKLANLCGIGYYLGNDVTTKLHRKTVVKDTIDLILLHTEYLRTQPKDRIDQAVQNYNIRKEYTNLFFFELKDEIFLTSSTEKDYYKLIKYNNVIAYLVLILITELAPGQILNLKTDKRCNYFFYSKLGETIFKDIYIRVNAKDKIPISNFPLFGYVLYYISCVLTSNKIWLWNEDLEEKKTDYNIAIQKTIIHTTIDLINSMVEANLEKDKNFLYEIFVNRFFIKLKNTYTDNQLMKRIDANINKKINFDEKTKKLSFLTKKITYVNVPARDEENEYDIKEKCETKTKVLKRKQYESDKNQINQLTNCEDGKFHQWNIIDKKLVCKLCNKEYEYSSTSSKNNIQYLDKLRLSFIKKLTKKYCLTGELHQIDPNTGVCSLCKINPETYEYTNKELEKLSNILSKKENDDILKNFKLINDYENKLKNITEENVKILAKFESRFDKNVLNAYKSNHLENYVIDFVDKLINILGKKIKIKNKTIYLKDTAYIIDHDYLGNDIREPITVLTSDDIIIKQENHPIFNSDIIYYKDKNNKVYVYYDVVTFQYLGYSEDNKNLKRNKNNASLKIQYSVKDNLMMLGLENVYTNLYHINSDLIHHFEPDYKNILDSILRNRIVNLKQIISRTQSIINSVRNHGRITNIHNLKEKEIINEFIIKLKKFNMKDKDGSNAVFKHSLELLNLINFKEINNIKYQTNKNYINNDILNKIINADSKLIYYIIMNFNRLLDYNTQTAIQAELAYIIIRIIQYSIDLYFKEYNVYELRKFEYLILADVPYIDETIKPIGLYQELFSGEIDETTKEQEKEKNIDAREEMEAIDVDDYEQDDDIDGTMEAFDGDIND